MVAKYGVEARGFAVKLSNAVKSAENIAFLGLNPGYLARNVVNNEVTMLARGAWSWSREAGEAFWREIKSRTAKRRSEGELLSADRPKALWLDEERTRQTLYYKGQSIQFGGSVFWQMFTMLYDAQGKVVTYEQLKETTHRDDINVAMGDLKRYLTKEGASDLAKAIKNSRLVGYRLDFDALG